MFLIKACSFFIKKSKYDISLLSNSKPFGATSNGKFHIQQALSEVIGHFLLYSIAKILGIVSLSDLIF